MKILTHILIMKKSWFVTIVHPNDWMIIHETDYVLHIPFFYPEEIYAWVENCGRKLVNFIILFSLSEPAKAT